MKIQYNSVIGVPVEDLNSQCIQCCFLDSGFYKYLPYPCWYKCRPGIQFKKSQCEVFKL